MESKRKSADSNIKNIKYWPQIIGTLSVCLSSVSLGTLLGYPTKALPQLKNETNIELRMDEYLGSWFAGSFWITGIFLCPLGGWLGGWFGRRKIILLASPLVFTGWTILGTAKNIHSIFLGRYISAMAVTCHMSSVGVYISETAHPNIRSNLTVLPALFMALGTWLIWIVAYFLPWRETAFISMIPSILLVLALLPLPETPYWLIEADRKDLAEKSLQFFRGPDYDITDEINEIKERHMSNLELQGESTSSWMWTFQRIFSSSFLKPFSCIGILYMLVAWTGFNTILTYMIDILNDSGSTIEPEMGPMIVGGVRIIFASIVPFVVSKIRPKLLFVTSMSISMVAVAAIGIYAFIKDNYPNSEILQSIGWLPLISIVFLVVMRGAGILPVLHPLKNELFPTEIRTQSLGITEACVLLSGCTSVITFPELKNYLGITGLCIVYVSVHVMCILWGAWTIPDNRGKSLVKVEETYEKKKDRTVSVKV